MGRSPCCPKEGLNRGAWTAHEDKVLKDYIRVHGEGRWRNLPKRAGLKRCGKSCRLRWLNYLRPDIKRGNISSDEEELIIRLHKLLGNRWSLIAGRLPGRTDNEIKNYWNTNLGKKVKNQTNQTSSSSRRPCASQENGKSTENPKPQITQPIQKANLSTPSPSSPTPPLKIDSHVFRTKATKCSKVLLINPPPPLPHSPITQSQQKHSNAVTEPEPEAVDADAVAKASDSLCEYDNEFVSFLSGEKEELSSDLLMDYDLVGDVCFSDLLSSSDFADMCGLSYSDNNNNNNNNSNDELLSSPCSDQPDPVVVFSDEIFKDWTHSDFAQDSNLSNSFTAVLESTEE